MLNVRKVFESIREQRCDHTSSCHWLNVITTDPMTPNLDEPQCVTNCGSGITVSLRSPETEIPTTNHIDAKTQFEKGPRIARFHVQRLEE